MTLPYAKLARAFAPRPTHTIEALGHRFIPSGEVEMLCRPCGFVIWKVETAEQAEEAVRSLGGSYCPERKGRMAMDKFKLAVLCEAAKAAQQPDLLSEAFSLLKPDSGPLPLISYARFQRLIITGKYEDAAKALIPKIWAILIDTIGPRVFVRLRSPHGPIDQNRDAIQAFGDTPALALCAAALRAPPDPPEDNSSHE